MDPLKEGFAVVLMLCDAKEQIAKMKRFRLIGAMSLAVFALGVAGASVAQAETAPYFTVGGTRLVAGKTHNFDARVFKGHSFTLSNASGVKITCEALGTQEGVLLGSNAESPGKDNEVIVFSKCELKEGNGAPECELANEAGTEPSTVITTFPVKSEQVENVVSSKVGNQLLEEFFPANTAAGFVDLHFKGAKCTLTETIVSGSTVAEDLTDNGKEEPINLGGTATEATSWLLKFPATPITQVWLISNGVGKIQKTGQKAFNAESIQTGTALVLLASTKHEPEPGALWSPLP